MTPRHAADRTNAALPKQARVWPLSRETPLKVRIGPRQPRRPDIQAAVDAEWGRLSGENPRVFDGPITAVVGFDPSTATVFCRRESYRMLAVANTVPTGTHQLGVSGLLVGSDRRGRRHILLGRRGRQTRIYGGMWEIGPAGGVDPPEESSMSRAAGGECVLTESDVVDCALAEAREELGFDLEPTWGKPICLYRDEAGNHDGIVIRFDLPMRIEECAGRQPRNTWEYSETAWVPVDNLQAFCREQSTAGSGAGSKNSGCDGVVPGAVGVFESLGWMRASSVDDVT